MTTQLQELWTTEEVAAAKKVSADYLRQLVRDGKVTPYRLSAAKNSPMRWADEHVKQVDAVMTPAVTPPAADKNHRRRRARRT